MRNFSKTDVNVIKKLARKRKIAVNGAFVIELCVNFNHDQWSRAMLLGAGGNGVDELLVITEPVRLFTITGVYSVNKIGSLFPSIHPTLCIPTTGHRSLRMRTSHAPLNYFINFKFSFAIEFGKIVVRAAV